ncbi:MAG: hypothetical protein N3A01_06710, partial [Bacteroidales bacterium]|nr:hypothetical protein [Bacteroidales bacterium]
MKTYYLVDLFLLLFISTLSQSITPSVISAGGVYNESNPIKIYSTIGEPVILSFYSTNNILTQGFQ